MGSATGSNGAGSHSIEAYTAFRVPGNEATEVIPRERERRARLTSPGLAPECSRPRAP